MYADSCTRLKEEEVSFWSQASKHLLLICFLVCFRSITFSGIFLGHIWVFSVWVDFNILIFYLRLVQIKIKIWFALLSIWIVFYESLIFKDLAALNHCISDSIKKIDRERQCQTLWIVTKVCNLNDRIETYAMEKFKVIINWNKKNKVSKLFLRRERERISYMDLCFHWQTAKVSTFTECPHTVWLQM